MDELEQKPIRWEWRYGLGIIMMAFAAAHIWWIVLYGKSENLLHQNSLSWAWITAAFIGGGLVLGTMAERLLPYLKR